MPKEKPTELELELVLLQAAMVARANEHEQNRPSTNDEISVFIEIVADQAGVIPDAEQKKLAIMGVQSLLVESEFLEEAMCFRLSNTPGEPLPIEFREKMLAAMQKSVDDFLRDRGK